MQRAGQTLPCQAPSRPSCLPTRPSLNRRCNTSKLDDNLRRTVEKAQQSEQPEGAGSGRRGTRDAQPEPQLIEVIIVLYPDNDGATVKQWLADNNVSYESEATSYGTHLYTYVPVGLLAQLGELEGIRTVKEVLEFSLP